MRRLLPFLALVALCGCGNSIRTRPGASGGGSPDAGSSSGVDAVVGQDAVAQGTDARPSFDAGFIDAATMRDAGPSATVNTIAAVQDPNHPNHPGPICTNDGSGVVGTCPQVVLTAVAVTAAGGYVSNGLRSLWLQDPTDADAQYAGIRVIYPRTAPYVPDVGDVVDVDAIAVVFRGGIQLEFATITRNGTATLAIGPTLVTPADIDQDNPNSHRYEGSLVLLQNAIVTTRCLTDDRDRDHGNWIVDNVVLVSSSFVYGYNGDLRPTEVQCFDTANDPTGLCGCSAPGGSARPNDMRSNGDRFSSITGVLEYSFGKYTIQPRGDFDLVRN